MKDFLEETCPLNFWWKRAPKKEIGVAVVRVDGMGH